MFTVYQVVQGLENQGMQHAWECPQINKSSEFNKTDCKRTSV
jgi:hypothetical protein